MLSILSVTGLILDVLSFLGIDLNSILNLKWRKYYQVIWKKTNKVHHTDFFEEFRNYQKFYLETIKLSSLVDKINNSQSILIVGQPLSGKSRLIFELIVKHLKKYRILKPNYVNIIDQNWKFPVASFFAKRKVLILDDLNFLIRLDSFSHLIRQASIKEIPIIASCRSGDELEQIKNYLEYKGIYLEALFSEKNTFELKKIGVKQAKEIANEVGINWESINFDGTIGSIFMKLYEMEKRYSQLKINEIKVLQLIKKLYLCGLFTGKLRFPLRWILKLWYEESDLKALDLELLLESLQKKDFISISGEFIAIEEVYLTEIVELVIRKDLIIYFEQMISIFRCIPEALATLGSYIHNISAHELAIIDLLNQAIHANSIAVKIFTLLYSELEVYLKKNTMKVHNIKKIKKEEDCIEEISEYTKKISRFSKRRLAEESYLLLYNLNIAHSQLGIEYGMLAEVVSKEDNSSLALKHFNISLTFFTKSSFSFEYSAINHNLSNIYRMLGEARDDLNSFKLSINSCEEALSFWTPELYPIQYANTHINLGNTLNHLAEFNNDEVALKESIQAYEEALRILTLEENPLKFASAHLNRARSYLILSNYEDSVENCSKGLFSCDEALKIYILQKYALLHARTQTTKGALLSKLAREKDKEINAKESIKSLLIALTVVDLTNFPMEYAIVQLNLSSSYIHLSEIEEEIKNSKKAVNSCEEALKVYTKEKFPFQYTITKSNLGIALINIAERENKIENARKAIQVYKEICKYYEEKKNLFRYSNGLMHQSIAYRILGSETSNVEYLHEAIILCNRSLRFFTKSKYPLQFGAVKINQSNNFLELAQYEEKEENCDRARNSCLEAMSIFTLEKYPENYKICKKNLANIENMCK